MKRLLVLSMLSLVFAAPVAAAPAARSTTILHISASA